MELAIVESFMIRLQRVEKTLLPNAADAMDSAITAGAALLPTLLEGETDLSPDETGACQGLSVQVRFEAIPVFLR